MIYFFVFQERHNAKTVGEIKQFVSQLPHMQAARSSLANHTSIAELIKDITSTHTTPLIWPLDCFTFHFVCILDRFSHHVFISKKTKPCGTQSVFQCNNINHLKSVTKTTSYLLFLLVVRTYNPVFLFSCSIVCYRCHLHLF